MYAMQRPLEFHNIVNYFMCVSLINYNSFYSVFFSFIFDERAYQSKLSVYLIISTSFSYSNSFVFSVHLIHIICLLLLVYIHTQFTFTFTLFFSLRYYYYCVLYLTLLRSSHIGIHIFFFARSFTTLHSLCHIFVAAMDENDFDKNELNFIALKCSSSDG